MGWRDFSADGRLAFRAVVVFVASVVGCVAGNWLRFPEIGTAIVFPPYAVVAAALMLTPRRQWPFYLAAGSAGCFAVHAVVGFTSSFVVVAEVANLTRALVAAIGVQAVARRPVRFDSLSAVAWFVLFAVILAPSVAALIGAGDVALLRGGAFWLAWEQWTLSNAVTGLTLLPILLAAAQLRGRPQATSLSRIVEGALLAAGLLTILVCVFALDGSTILATLCLPMPFLLWAAVRFGPGAASAALGCAAILTVWGATHGHGPFVAESPTDNLLQLNLFLIAISLPIHLLAGVVEEARRTSAELRESRELARSIVQDQSELICRFRPDGTCTFVNLAYCRYFGRTEAELLGSDLHAVDPSLRRRLAAHEMTPENPISTTETDLEGAGGARRYQAWRDRAFFDESGRIVELQSVGRDITDQLRAEEERAELMAQRKLALALREESRQKDDFMAILGHELRTPLMPLALAPRQLRAIQTDDARLGHISDVVARQVRQLMRLTNDLLDVARISRGKLDLELGRVELRAVVEQAVEVVTPLIDARGQKLTIAAAPDIAVLGDAARLCQVVTNLLHNSAKYTPDGGRIDVDIDVDRESARIRVRDSGIGISSAMLTRIFELFEQAGGGRDGGRTGGLGLGLTIVKRIVELHGGSVEASSRGPGLGTEICVRLRVLRDEPGLFIEKAASKKTTSRPPSASSTSE